MNSCMNLEELQRLITEAMRAKDSAKLSTLRLIKVALQNEAIGLGHPLSDVELQAVLRRELKKREESVTAYTEAGRLEMADLEQTEADMLRSYLPQPLGIEEIRSAALTLIKESGSIPQAGPLIGSLMKQLGSRADGGDVSKVVRELLA